MQSIGQSWLQLLIFLSIVEGDFSSDKIAFWDRPRAALIRDYVYLEGGWMQTGSWKDGAWDVDSLTTVNPSNGMLLKLNMHKSFGLSSNEAPAVFETIPESGVQNFYVDGYMFATDNEFYAWGGMALTNASTQRIVSNPLYENSGATSIQRDIPNLNYKPLNKTFATNGAGTNAPSESLGFYFGGLYNKNSTEYSYFSPPMDQSLWLITVQMAKVGNASWTKTALGDPGIVKWRCEGGLVWVPTSTAGILIAIGGVAKPADLNFEVPQDNATESRNFLKQFPVYDIGSGTWILQMLNEGSPFPDNPLAQFCTVVASTLDGSHHDIFVYGGWDSNGGPAQSDVWVLTVPSFTWVKVQNSGRAGTARESHVCVSPYPDQMIVIGGTGTGDTPPTYQNAVDVFNLNSLNWTGTYDPQVYDVYRPNQAILDVIAATPTASNMPAKIAGWFDVKYDMSKIKFYGPYEAECAAGFPNDTTDPARASPELGA